jgi:hypothetical protein
VVLRDVPNAAIGIVVFTSVLGYALGRLLIFRLEQGR